MLSEYLGALFMIFAAEMGDKTQILAMMFATKYKTNKVMLGIFVGSFLNHGLAVLFGALLGNFIDVSILQMIAGIAFIGFSFWTMLSQVEEEEEEKTLVSKGAVMTVALAFFIGELGDKTQLTAITLSVDAIYPAIILLGTVSGMLVTSSIGIFVGSKIGEKIPELWIKILSGAIFLVFGILKLLEGTPERFINVFTSTTFVLVVLAGLVYLTHLTFKGFKSGELTPYRRAAKQLYDYKHTNALFVEEICRTTTYCGNCMGEACGIGLIRHILKDLDQVSLDNHHLEAMETIGQERGKFSESKLIHMLEVNIGFLLSYKINDAKKIEADTIRKVIEVLLIGEWVELGKTEKEYIDALKKKNGIIAERIERFIKKV